MLNILLAFSEYETGIKIRTILSSYGLVTTAIASSITQVQSFANRYQGHGVVICQKDFRDGMCTSLKGRLPPSYQIIALVRNIPSDTEMFEGITTLTLPLKKQDLIDTIRMLDELSNKKNNTNYKNNESNKLTAIGKSKRTPEEEKAIQDAKALLMNRNNFTEEQAHRFIQKKSMDAGMKFSAAAKSILERW